MKIEINKKAMRQFNVLAEKAGLDQEAIRRLRERGYFDAPASKGHHLAHPGGLLEHSVNVADKLAHLTKTLGIEWTRPEGPYIVGLLHDLVKCDCYEIYMGEEDYVIRWCDRWGDRHGKASLDICAELEIELMYDEAVCIAYHMGRFGVGKEYLERDYREILEDYGPQALATHFADWWSSAVTEEKTSARD